MSSADWEEFLAHDKHKESLLANLQLFLHEKCINFDSTAGHQHYGELCNMAEYPGTYIPFRDDIPAKNSHLRHMDQDIPHHPRTPKTYFYTPHLWVPQIRMRFQHRPSFFPLAKPLSHPSQLPFHHPFPLFHLRPSTT